MNSEGRRAAAVALLLVPVSINEKGEFDNASKDIAVKDEN